MSKKEAATQELVIGQDVEFEFDGRKMIGQVGAIVPPNTKVWGGTTFGDLNFSLGLDVGEVNTHYLDQNHTRHETRAEKSYLILEDYSNTGDRRRVYWPDAEKVKPTTVGA